MEITRIPNLNWPVVIAYGLLFYSSYLVWRRARSLWSLVSALSFGLLLILNLVPVIFFVFPALLPVLHPALLFFGWPISLIFLVGALALALALRSLPGQAPNKRL